MRVPIAWLRDYIDLTLSTDQIVERLALLGFPVEEVIRRPCLSGVTIGRIERIAKHPNADRLQVCTMNVGGEHPLTIVTAAENVAAGQVVPVATIGARLVGIEIARRAMRGIESQGMLCSADEVGLEPAWFDDGIIQLDADLPLGADFIELFRLRDDVLEIEVTANRVDAMSVLGIARELAAALELALREPETALRRAPAPSSDTRVTIESPDCKRFVAQRFSGLRVGTAPFWLRVRLALAGQRPITNVVDISNFVMLETAQPLHFYDFAKLAGGRLIVRDAGHGELLETLDGQERTLDPSFLVIADERAPQGLAGLMGGAASEVSSATNELLLESATFTGARIRRMGAALGLRTEASTRHEKGLPPGLAGMAAARAAKLLEDEGATVRAAFAVGEELEKLAPIRITSAQVRGLLGIELPDHAIERALRALGFDVQRSIQEPQLGEGPKVCFEATPPYWRGDVKIREDLIEEVARIAGYDKIEAVQPPVFAQSIDSAEYDRERRVAHAIAALGYLEAVSWSLQPAAVRERYERAGIPVAAQPVEIANPLSEDQRYLRFSLLPGLLALAARHQGDEALRLFEIGHVFEAGAEKPFETAMCAWLFARPHGDEPAWRDPGFLEFKGDSLAIVRKLTGREALAVSTTHSELHPGKTATLLLDGEDVARIGAVDPRLLLAYEIENDVYAATVRLCDLPPYRVPRYAPGSRFPAIARDLAVVVAPDIPALDIEHAVRAGGDSVLADVHVFDEYRGPQVEAGKKSIAVRVVLQRPDATLTDAEADRYVAAIVASLRERVGARIRE